MIYTLTLNPSLDYLLDTPDLKLGETNRSTSESIHFGGKGINVSFVLKELGIDSVCLGFTAGFTGDELENCLRSAGLKTDLVHLDKGSTRINVKIKDKDITEINAKGPEITDDDMEKLFIKLEKLTDGDTLILAGSVPKGFDCIYSDIMRRLSGKSIRFVVDTTGEKLVSCLKYRPYLIKPNLSELCEITGETLSTIEEIEKAAKKLQSQGAVNVLVSMGDKGAILLDENGKTYTAEPIKIIPVNTVGAGDSMVAGFIAGVDRGYNYALKLGNACGAASAKSRVLLTKELVEEFMNL